MHGFNAIAIAVVWSQSKKFRAKMGHFGKA